MDFMNRDVNQQTPRGGNRPPAENITSSSTTTGGSHIGHSGPSKLQKFFKLGSFVLLLLLTLLAVFIVIYLSRATSVTQKEAKLVDTSKLQAVFLTSGQVYFGNIKDINSKYILLDNIYYLTTNQAVQPGSSTPSTNNVQLVKLGCELHAPYDQMAINLQQVTFWENLKSDGQVAKAVAQYKQQNPNGQVCTTANSSTTAPTATPTPSVKK